MTTAIAGTKTSKYIKEPIAGIDNSTDTLTYQSVQNLWDSRGASDVLIHALYASTAIPYTIEVGSVKRLIKITGHGAIVGDFVRMNNGNSDSEEVAIIKIIDADFVVIAKEIDASIGDELFIMKNVTPTYNKDGSLNVSNGPIQFVRNALVAQVIEDTVTPANNIPLPSALFTKINGVSLAVNKDTVTPANTVSIPVEITGASGPINITAGDLNVQLSDQGANPDVTRIGNGTNQLGINASNEALVRDADSITGLASLLTELQLKADLTETQPVSFASLPLPAGAATSAKQDLLLTELQLKADLSETQPVSIAGTVAISGALTDAQLRASSVPVSGTFFQATQPVSAASLPLPTGASTEAKQDTQITRLNLLGTEATLSAQSAKLPASLGSKTSAASLSVTPASDAIYSTKDRVRTSSFAEFLTLTTVQTFTAPANAFGALIQASDANAANVRIKQGAAATITSGIQMQPGRSENLYGGTDISVISESGTNAISVIWFIQG